jgi:hypothetical protein
MAFCAFVLEEFLLTAGQQRLVFSHYSETRDQRSTLLAVHKKTTVNIKCVNEMNQNGNSSHWTRK